MIFTVHNPFILAAAGAINRGNRKPEIE